MWRGGLEDGDDRVAADKSSGAEAPSIMQESAEVSF